MCGFKSAIVTRQGDLLISDWTESHEDLVEIFNLRDNTMGHFCRIEYVPEENPCDLDTYKLKIDESEAPSWWNEEIEKRTIKKLNAWLKPRIITTGEHVLLIGQQYIIGGNAKVEQIKNAMVVYIRGDAQVESIKNAHVMFIHEAAQVGQIYSNVQVECMFGDARVEYIHEDVTVWHVLDNVQVGRIDGNAKIIYDGRK